jgi:predicted RNA-binding protein YlqC (UPF0109 family)
MTDVLTRDKLALSMIELVAGMARALVDYPDQVSVEAASESGGTVLLLKVAPADLGKVIGKQGRTARSMRTILGAASMKAQHRFALDIQRVDEPPSA